MREFGGLAHFRCSSSDPSEGFHLVRPWPPLRRGSLKLEVKFDEMGREGTVWADTQRNEKYIVDVGFYVVKMDTEGFG